METNLNTDNQTNRKTGSQKNREKLFCNITDDILGQNVFFFKRNMSPKLLLHPSMTD